MRINNEHSRDDCWEDYFNRIFPDDFPYINDSVEDAVDESVYTGAVIKSKKDRSIKEIVKDAPLGQPVKKVPRSAYSNVSPEIWECRNSFDS